MDSFLIDEGVDGAMMELTSGEQLAGQDLRALVMTSRTAQAHIQRLTTRGRRPSPWSRRPSPVCSARKPDPAAAAARLDLYAEEGDGHWSAEPAAAGMGYVFGRVKRGVSERIVLDDVLLHALDARRLEERAAVLADTFSKPAIFRRKDKSTTVRGPLDLVAAVLDAGRTRAARACRSSATRASAK